MVERKNTGSKDDFDELKLNSDQAIKKHFESDGIFPIGPFLTLIIIREDITVNTCD